MTRIMYVCDLCAEGNPENCGHYDRDELRVAPDGTTVCDDCYEDGEAAHSMTEDEYRNRTPWRDLPIPVEFVPATPETTER